MGESILVTGSEGLVGTALVRALLERGEPLVALDLRAKGERSRGDVRDASALSRAIPGCRGVVHLAAVSRVVWGERDPASCWSTNVDGTRDVLRAAMVSRSRPWVILASSREVYGEAEQLPATEDTPLRPVNIYGRSKVAGERLVAEARDSGLRAAVVRLSNVYGSTADHADRVVPAFAAAGVRGQQLRVDGSSHTFDFTHVDDTVRGLLALAELLDSERAPPPIHLLTGQATTLGDLAELAVGLAGSKSKVVEAPPRAFDVSRFYGDPARARAILGWKPEVSLEAGLDRLIKDFQRHAATAEGFPAR